MTGSEAGSTEKIVRSGAAARKASSRPKWTATLSGAPVSQPRRGRRAGRSGFRGRISRLAFGAWRQIGAGGGDAPGVRTGLQRPLPRVRIVTGPRPAPPHPYGQAAGIMPHPGHAEAFRRRPDHVRATFGSGAPAPQEIALIQSQTLSFPRANLRPVLLTGAVLAAGLVPQRLRHA